MRKLLPAVVAAMSLLIPASAYAYPQPSPQLNRSETVVKIENETTDGAWITVYRYVRAGPVKLGKQQIVDAFCAEPKRVTQKSILIDADKVRAEVKPGCRGALKLDQEHLTHHGGGMSMSRPNTSAEFRRFYGRVLVSNGRYIFADITPQ